MTETIRELTDHIREEAHALHGQAAYALDPTIVRAAAIRACRRIERLTVLIDAAVGELVEVGI